MRILLAIGHESLERYLKDNNKDCDFVGEISYREAIVKNCLINNPDIVIIRETLPGSQNILDIIYELRQKCFKTRIIFISKERKIGDPLLAELVSLGVYDFITSNPVKVTDIMSLIHEANSFSDVSYYREKITVDENNNDVIFATPKQIIKKVYVEKGPNGELIEKEVVDETLDKNKQFEETISNKKKDTSSDEINYLRNTEDVSFNLDGESKKSNIDLDNKIVKKEKRRGRPPKDTLKKTLKNKTNIVTFANSFHGVGSTQCSFNMAIELSKNYKTLYVEISELYFSIYNILYLSNVKGFEVYKNDSTLETSIIDKNFIIKNARDKNDLIKNYKLLPKDLSLMFLAAGDVLSFENFKDMLINLTLKYDYEFIIFDLGSNLNTDISNFLISTSNIVFIVTTQDFNYICNTEILLNKLKKSSSLNKINVLVNKYEDAIGVDNNKLKEFIPDNKILTIPYNKEFNYFNYIGAPCILKTKDKIYANSINNIINELFNLLK